MFQTALFNVFLSLLYMLPGYLFCKLRRASADHLSTMSTILIYFCSPCMIIDSFLGLTKSNENLVNMGLFFAFSLLMQLLFFVLLFLILRKKHENPVYRMLNAGSILGNVGFFGLPLIRSIFPDHPEVACYSSIYVVSMNLLVFTIGVYCITGEKKYVSFKNAFINPTFIAFLIAMPLYLFNAGEWIPEFLQNGLGILGKMTTPLCMIILGIRLASVGFSKIWGNPFPYLTAGMKLLVFPLFCFGLSLLFPLEPVFRYSVLILAGTPCASVLLGMAEIHGKNTDLAANCILLSTLLSIFTLPLLALLIRM